jgi:class 3 adenylate cyclase/tetratricopeptide (TPR) repeat protein
MRAPIADWLVKIGLAEYTELFVENELDLETLRDLTDADLRELGLPFGPRKRLLNALKQATEPDGERRQLTVLYCDIVGSTQLAQLVDPEVLQTIIGLYEDTCAECISRYDGYIHQRQGDGLIAFFGFPFAHEGEAARAIRSGLEIIEAMARLEVPEVGRLSVRVAIATGITVVATIERGAFGETMNLAARLQGAAKPGSVVVSERVYRLAGGEFEYESLGELDLKGIDVSTRAYVVLGIGKAASRFDAVVRWNMSPLVGRAHEMETLLERWHSVCDRNIGQTVLLSGEPGFGKSRVAYSLLERVAADGVQPLLFQCSPFFVNSAFHPWIANLERTLEFGRDETPDSRLDKLEALLVRVHGQPLEDVRFIAAMLSLPYESRYGPLTLTPRIAKEETIRVVVNIVKAAALAEPSLLLFEDLHWADPTTLETLSALIERLDSIPVLVMLTYRPEFEPPWLRHDRVAQLNLSRLDQAESRQLVSNVTRGKPLPAELVAQIIDKTDGVPLFVEELTKSITESGELIKQGDRYLYAGSSVTVSIPDTLRDSLMARLDRVAAVKRIAQVGSVVGREFSYELVAEIVMMSEAALADVLSRLVASELASCRGEPPQAVYTFKHALVQDTAYDSLLKSQRMALHARIAQALERRPESRDTVPELLAHHYTAAGLFEAAIPYWRRAGELAMQRFVLSEAITHLNNGLMLIEKTPAGPQRDLKELELRTVLGPAVVAQHGWGNSEVSRILEPAWSLAESLDHRPSYAPVLHSLWVHYLCVDQLALSLKSTEKLLAAGAATRDDSLVLVAYRAAVGSHYWLGDFEAARQNGDALRAMYDPQRHWHIAEQTITDPLTGDGIYRGQYLWMLGYPEQARAESDAKDEHARRRNHPFDLAFALTLGAQVFDYLCEPEELLRRTEEAERVCHTHGVALLGENMAQISRGIVLLRAGRAAESVVQFEKAIGRQEATGHRLWMRYLRGLQGEGLALTGDLERARALIDATVLATQSGEERAHYAELLRLRAWVLMLQGHAEEAEVGFRAAIDVARSQKARSWELRSTTTYARLLADRGDRAWARKMLLEIYGWFTEGFDTKDLREARALLDVLQD